MTEEQKQSHNNVDAQEQPVEADQSRVEANGQVVEGEVVEGEVVEPSVSETHDFQMRLQQAEAQAANYKDQWMRSAADFKNYKRRAETERAELIRSASSGMVLKILPVLDDFERAVSSVPAEIAQTPWWNGMQLIEQKIRTLLESEGVKPIEAMGKDFDPNFHDAVMYEESEGQENKVVAELQKGYTQYDRVLRPTMVKVGKG